VKTRPLAILIATFAVVSLSGCFGGPGAGQAQQVADWVADQAGVTDASSGLAGDYDTILLLDVDIEPELSDDDLVSLAHSIDDHAAHSGWGQYAITYHLGENRAFSSLGGDPTLQVFLAIRHEDYTQAFARGGGEGVKGFFYISQPGTDGLEDALQGLVDAARAVGDIQTNLQFTAETDDGAVTLSGTYEEVPAKASAEWRVLAEQFPLDSVWALALETGDEKLILHVADAATQAEVEAAAAQQSDVDVEVYLTE
jgi:hypothetical protein